MTSTITSTSTSWTITGSDGRIAGSSKNRASATLQPDNTVVVESDGGETLWAGNIMTLGGLVGATAALRFADLLNTYLTGLPISNVIGVQRYTMQGANFTWTSGTGEYNVPYNADSMSSGVVCTRRTGVPGEIEILVTGRYIVNANCQIQNVAGGTGSLGFRLARGAITQTRTRLPSATGWWNAATTQIANFNVGDIITFKSDSNGVGTSGVTQYEIGSQTNRQSTEISFACIYTTTKPVPIISNARSGFVVTNAGPTPSTFALGFTRLTWNLYNRNEGNLTWDAGTNQTVQDLRGKVVSFNVMVQGLVPSTGTVEIQLVLGPLVFHQRYLPNYDGCYQLNITTLCLDDAAPYYGYAQINSTVADGQYDVGGAVGYSRSWFAAQLIA